MSQATQPSKALLVTSGVSVIGTLGLFLVGLCLSLPGLAEAPAQPNAQPAKPCPEPIVPGPGPGPQPDPQPGPGPGPHNPRPHPGPRPGPRPNPSP